MVWQNCTQRLDGSVSPLPICYLGCVYCDAKPFHAIVVLRTDDVGRGGSTQAHNSKLIKFVSDRFVTPDVGQTRPYGIRRHGLPEIVRAFKSFSARRINQKRRLPGIAVWQRNYYEHIIRNQSDLDCIRLYIGDNPRRWAEDPENQK